MLACALAAAAIPSAVHPDSKCDGASRIVIAAAGDIIVQPALEARLRARGTPYRGLWRGIEPVIAAADLAYANVEGPIAVKEGEASLVAAPAGGPLDFNYRASLVGDLKFAGFDVVSTANNHALDAAGIGADLTIDRLREGGIAFTGTRKRRGGETWSTLTSARGFTVAWLACSYGTNGIPDLSRQVLRCFDDEGELLAEIGRRHADASIAAVIVVPHWGIENAMVVEQRQQRLARSMIEAGATAVIGTHPHVVQRWERLRAADGRDGLVIYSTGNLVSAQTSKAQRLGIVAIIELSRSSTSPKAQVSAARYVLTRIVDRGGIAAVEEAEATTTVAALPAADRVPLSDIARRSCAD